MSESKDDAANDVWMKSLLSVKRTVVKPFSDQFKVEYDAIALESARRQMSLNDELQRVGTSKGWHLDLTHSILELDGISLPGAVLLGTNTLGEFLWADENHPSAQNLAPFSMQSLRQLRSKFPDVPEVISSGIQVQGALEDPVSVGYLVSAIASVGMGPTWAYYRAPRSETSWGWIIFDASPLGGIFSKTSTRRDSSVDPLQLATELRRFGVQLALSPIPPFDFRRAARSFCYLRLLGYEEISKLGRGSNNNNNNMKSTALNAMNKTFLESVLEERNLTPQEVEKVLREKRLAVLETDRSSLSGSKDLSRTGMSNDSIDDLDESLDVEFVSEPDSGEQVNLEGWSRLLIWSLSGNRNIDASLYASLVFDGLGRVHKVGSKVSIQTPPVARSTNNNNSPPSVPRSGGSSSKERQAISNGESLQSNNNINNNINSAITAPLLLHQQANQKSEECCSGVRCVVS